MMETISLVFWTVTFAGGAYPFWRQRWAPELFPQFSGEDLLGLSVAMTLLSALLFGGGVTFIDDIHDGAGILALVGIPLVVAITSIIAFGFRRQEPSTRLENSDPKKEMGGAAVDVKESQKNEVNVKSNNRPETTFLERITTPEFKKIAASITKYFVAPIVVLLLYYFVIGKIVLEMEPKGSAYVAALLGGITIYCINEYRNERSQRAVNVALITIFAFTAFRIITIYLEQIKEFVFNLFVAITFLTFILAWGMMKREPKQENGVHIIVAGGDSATKVSVVGICHSCGKSDGVRDTNYPGWRVRVKPRTIRGQLTYLCQRCAGDC